MIRNLYLRLPGPRPVRLATMTLASLVLLTAVIWSYEILGDMLDSGGALGE
ncbi:MAG: hypothetical protein ACR2OI_08570 [Acidimicrobiia bacterium]